MRRTRGERWALALALAGCGEGGAGSGTATDGITTAPPVTTVTPTTTTPTTGDAGGDSGTSTGDAPGTSAAATTAGDDSGGFKLDVGVPDFGGERETSADSGCVAVDLLFVIDNSPSMGPHQEALTEAFPGFIDAIFAALPVGTDLHVGITTTSFFDGSCSESTNNCVSQSSEAEILEHYDTPDQSDNGENGGQGRLFTHAGMSFFAGNTGDDPGALKTWFTAAATAAGETGCSFEMPAAAAGWAVDPANAGANAGFLRDEGAVLLVFVLSDEPDKSPEPVGQFVDKLAAAKAGCGGIDCILAAGLVPDFCYDHPGDPTLKTFLESFAAPPFTGSIEGSPAEYSAVVGDALAQVIGQKCEELQPPG